MSKKVYYRVYYCKKCFNLYTKAGWSYKCSHDFDVYTLEATIENNELMIKIVPGILKFNV